MATSGAKMATSGVKMATSGVKMATSGVENPSREINDRSRDRAHHTPGLPSASLPPIAELIIRFTWGRSSTPHNKPAILMSSQSIRRE